MLADDPIVVVFFDDAFDVQFFVSGGDDEERRLRSDALVGFLRDRDLRHTGWIIALADDLERLSDSGERRVEVLNPLIHGAEQRLVYAYPRSPVVHQPQSYAGRVRRTAHLVVMEVMSALVRLAAAVAKLALAPL